MGLCAQDLVCAGSSPFQSVINCLVCIGRKQLSNKLGAVGCVGRTYSRSLWKWRLLGGLCLQCWLLACIGVRRLKVDMWVGNMSLYVCTKLGGEWVWLIPHQRKSNLSHYDAMQMGLCAQDLVRTDSSPFQSVL